MLVYAGIDEAGYGPMLGPLCVACTVFVIEDHDPDHGPCDLWKRLSKAVCRKRADSKRRIAVDDSKKLKGARDGPTHPLLALERGVLSFLSTTSPDAPCGCDEDLFNRLGIAVGDAPWYGSRSALPVAQGPDVLQVASGRLRTVLQSQGVRCDWLRCEAIDAGEFNQQVRRMGAKSSVNFCAVLRHIDAVWNRWPDAHPRVVVDRQGGRTHYLDDLMACWPDASIQVLGETPALSRYRLGLNGRRLTVSFQVEAESCNLPVALASMTAKYSRELLMLRLNRYFQGHLPELKPTAGYVEDARRYIAEIEALIGRLGFERDRLVRMV